MKGPFLVLAILALSARISLAGDAPAGTESVPAEEVRGRVLVLEDMNASIEAPGDDWVWLQESGVRSKELRRYICRAADGSHSYYFGLYNRNLDPWTEKSAHDWVLGVLSAEQIRKLGFKFVECVPDYIPLDSGCFRYEAKAEATDSLPALRLRGFVAYRERAYSFQFIASEMAMATYDPEFERFVRSFRLLRAAGSPSPPASPWVMIIIATALTLGGVAGLGIWLGLKDIRPHGSRVAGTYGCVLLGAAFIFPALAGPLIYPKANHYKLGEVFGQLFMGVLGAGAIPALLLAFVLRSRVTRSSPDPQEPHAGPPSQPSGNSPGGPP